MNADEIAAENRRKRTFKKFTYRGVEVRRPASAAERMHRDSEYSPI